MQKLSDVLSNRPSGTGKLRNIYDTASNQTTFISCFNGNKTKPFFAISNAKYVLLLDMNIKGLIYLLLRVGILNIGHNLEKLVQKGKECKNVISWANSRSTMF